MSRSRGSLLRAIKRQVERGQFAEALSGIDTVLESLQGELSLEEENRRLRVCAAKYLAWLNVEDPEAGLEKDLRNPAMHREGR